MKKQRIYLPKEDIANQLEFLDGTKYIKMPNGELRRMSPRSYQIRKNNKKSIK